ncbi:MAG: hypothetical protein A2Y38_08070 [Spirochaetes bacterium GWB1_59_5]|nr:MAG: hypothetical protein A2Y38_08070 [Spirochaetes bacterium GWB1_59_5]
MAFSDKDKALLKAVQDKLRVTKVVCTRAIKTKNGDFFVGFSAAWDTVQEDAGGMGADMVDALGDGEAALAADTCGMTVREAKLAAYILGRMTDLQAQDNALAGGGISASEHAVAQTAVKRNYMKLMADALAVDAAKQTNGST